MSVSTGTQHFRQLRVNAPTAVLTHSDYDQATLSLVLAPSLTGNPEADLDTPHTTLPGLQKPKKNPQEVVIGGDPRLSTEWEAKILAQTR